MLNNIYEGYNIAAQKICAKLITFLQIYKRIYDYLYLAFAVRCSITILKVKVLFHDLSM